MIYVVNVAHVRRRELRFPIDSEHISRNKGGWEAKSSDEVELCNRSVINIV